MVRDYIFVKDVARAYLLLAEKNESQKISGEAFNFSNEKPLTVLEIVEEIRKLMKKENLTPEVLNMPLKEIYEQYLSSKKAHDILGWHPEYDLTRGLEETISWYKNFLKNESK